MFTLSYLLLIPAIYSWSSGQQHAIAFLAPALFGYAVAGLLRIKVNQSVQLRLRVQELFLSTVLAWLSATAICIIPFLSIQPSISITDAWFETLSGLTTTGSSIFRDLSDIPAVLLLWRSLLQWLGGLGFMLMAVALVTVLDVSGLRLLHREAVEWVEKTAPRMRSVARQILVLYGALTLLCCLGFYSSGLSLFNAWNYALTTVSTGGFSTVGDPTLLWSTAAQWNAIIFMLLSALPLLLLVQAATHYDWKPLWRDQQVRGELAWLVIWVLLLTGWLMLADQQPLTATFRTACFTVINMLSTTGYSSSTMVVGDPLMLLLLTGIGMIGGCSGSTVGGIKLFRLQISYKLFIAQIKQLIHPNAVATAYYNGRPIPDALMRATIAFLMAFIGIWLLIIVVLMLSGVAGTTAASAAMAAVSNVGIALAPGIGPSGHFADLPNCAKWALSFGMLCGRLEFMTLLVLFFPAFWKE